MSAAQQPREHVSAGVAAGPGTCPQLRDVCPAHQATPDERRFDPELAGLVLDGLGARCADRLGLAALSCVLGDHASAAPASPSASCGALEQSQRELHCAGIGGNSCGWLRIGHGRERYHEPSNHDTVTVQCSRSRILSQAGDCAMSRLSAFKMIKRRARKAEGCRPRSARTASAAPGSPSIERNRGGIEFRAETQPPGFLRRSDSSSLLFPWCEVYVECSCQRAPPSSYQGLPSLLRPFDHGQESLLGLPHLIVLSASVTATSPSSQ